MLDWGVETMYDAKVTEFSVDLPYEVTCYEPLKALAKNHEWMKSKKKTRWTFHLIHLPEVIALLGKPIEFSLDSKNMELILDHCPNLEEEIYMRRYKGKGNITVRRGQKALEKDGPEIDVFIVTWQMRKKPSRHYIPIETVYRLWNVINRYDLNDEVPTHLCCEHYCKEMGIVRFNRAKSGSFDFQKFFGDRKAYYKWYGAMKVLQHYRMVQHKRSGYIIRLAENLKFDSRFNIQDKEKRENHSLMDFPGQQP